MYLVHDVGRVVALGQHRVIEVRVVVEVELEGEAQEVRLVHAPHVRQVIQRLQVRLAVTGERGVKSIAAGQSCNAKTFTRRLWVPRMLDVSRETGDHR